MMKITRKWQWLAGIVAVLMVVGGVVIVGPVSMQIVAALKWSSGMR